MQKYRHLITLNKCIWYSCFKVFVSILHSFVDLRGSISLRISGYSLRKQTLRNLKRSSFSESFAISELSWGGGQWVNLRVYTRRCVLPLLAPDCNCLWKHLVKIQVNWNQSLSQSFHGTCQVITPVVKVQVCIKSFCKIVRCS